MILAKQVPWKDWCEWNYVRDKLVARDRDAHACALSRIRCWQTRHRIPVSIEATASLLEVLQVDPSAYSTGSSGPHTPSADLSLMVCQVITRSVNLLVDLAQKGSCATSMDKLAGSIGIPSWVVQLRHNATHGSTPPYFRVLRHAVLDLLDNFFIPRYWNNQWDIICHSQGESLRPDTELITIPELSRYFAGRRDESFLGRVASLQDWDPKVLHWIVTNDFRDTTDLFVELFGKLRSDDIRLQILDLLILYRNRFALISLIRDQQYSALSKLRIQERCADLTVDEINDLLSLLSDTLTPIENSEKVLPYVTCFIEIPFGTPRPRSAGIVLNLSLSAD